MSGNKNNHKRKQDEQQSSTLGEVLSVGEVLDEFGREGLIIAIKIVPNYVRNKCSYQAQTLNFN